MMRTLSCIGVLFLAIVGCSDPVAEPFPVEENVAIKGIGTSSPAPIEYSNDTLAITPEGGATAALGIGAAPLAIDDPDDAAVKVNLIRVARIPAPVVGGSTVQANDIVIDGNTAYIAYNYQGGPWIGAVQALDITDPTTPVHLWNQIDFASMDINALGVDGAKLLITGAADPSVWGGVVTTPAFAAHAAAGAPVPADIAASVVGLPLLRRHRHRASRRQLLRRGGRLGRIDPGARHGLRLRRPAGLRRHS